MDNVISLNNKLKLSATQKASAIRRQKIQAVRKIFQCTRCASKCERCGIAIGLDPQEKNDSAPLPYNFCSSCAQEYLDYINTLQGKADPETYWHNEEWLNLWRHWIDYQGAIDQYKRSKEFMRLLVELRQDNNENE